MQGLGDTQGSARSCWEVPPMQPMEGNLWGSGVAPPQGCGTLGPWGCWAPRLERLEMGKIHSTETETIKGAEEAHKEV